jgi:hypothetical protein
VTVPGREDVNVSAFGEGDPSNRLGAGQPEARLVAEDRWLPRLEDRLHALTAEFDEGPGPLRPRPYDYHGAGCVPDALVTHRSDKQSTEATMATGADDEHVRTLGPTQEHRGRIACLHDSLDVQGRLAS